MNLARGACSRVVLRKHRRPVSRSEHNTVSCLQKYVPRLSKEFCSFLCSLAELILGLGWVTPRVVCIFEALSGKLNRVPSLSEMIFSDYHGRRGILGLKNGAILVSLCWVAILVHIIDLKWWQASGWALTSAIFSAIGIIHVPVTQPHSLSPDPVLLSESRSPINIFAVHFCCLS